MRYAIFSDIHANLEALEAVLTKIDELAQEEPIDQIWFLGDLVGYGPNPNECIVALRERTDVIIAGNHDWAAIGKIDLEDFSEAARISAEWTAEQLTEEHRQFLLELPEQLVIGECTLVHGSPYGPLWEYLTSEVLAERSFQHFTTRYCLVGHTHVPIIFQQPDTIATTPTVPLAREEAPETTSLTATEHVHNNSLDHEEDDTTEMVAVTPTQQANSVAAQPPHAIPESSPVHVDTPSRQQGEQYSEELPPSKEPEQTERAVPGEEEASSDNEAEPSTQEVDPANDEESSSSQEETAEEHNDEEVGTAQKETTPEDVIQNAEDRLNQEIEELLALLGLSQSMIKVSNEMIIPPEGDWQAPEGFRAIINPGGVGQPRDGDPRAAFLIYDTERGFTFYRVQYTIEKTQEKIIEAGLPSYLATRLAYGR
jgi:diadenosine tetraphosphatase ApaH/serine/threonine PP2A family protein phosphatase